MTASAKPKATTTAAAPAPEVRERLTAAVAQSRGLVPPGHVFDEESQTAIPRGDAMVHAALAQPMDLQRNLDEWDRNRQTLVRFIEKKLEESDYDTKGYPVAGQMHDYYKLPSYDKRVLTKRGAERIAQLHRYARASTETVQREITKDHTLAVVRVVLWDQYRRPIGSGEAACSTAERGFQGGNAKKYGGDMRAAVNDVIARAGKRAFVQAVVYAIAGDELFETEPTRAAAHEDDEEHAPAATAARFPEKFGKIGGKRIAEVDTETLIRAATWCRQDAKKPQAVAPLADAIDEELERRRGDDDADEMPF